jgi:hypothetical protein
MPADVLIFDISGKKVFEISGMVMNSVESIPVSSLPKGSYILTVRSANLVKSFKIIRL